MSNTNGAPEQPEQPKVSRIVLTFPGGEGTTGCTIHAENVDEGQINGAAYFLDLYAHDVHAMIQAQRLQLVAPPGAMPGVPAPDVQRVLTELLNRRPS